MYYYYFRSGDHNGSKVCRYDIVKSRFKKIERIGVIRPNKSGTWSNTMQDMVRVAWDDGDVRWENIFELSLIRRGEEKLLSWI